MRKIDLSYFVSNETDLLIAGFGGSANTYATYAILDRYPGVNLSHHLHVPAQVIKAAQLGIPCLVLVRHPIDAISSLTTRNGIEFSIDGLGWALMDYRSYYDAVVGCRDSFIACGFRDVVEDYNTVLQRLNHRFGTDFSAPTSGTEESKKIISAHKTRGVNRTCALEDVQAMLKSPALKNARADAERSYKNFCDRTGTKFWKDPDRPPLARREK